MLNDLVRAADEDEVAGRHVAQDGALAAALRAALQRRQLQHLQEMRRNEGSHWVPRT